MSNRPFAIALAVALEAEARPLIARFRLRRDLAVTPFHLYENHADGIVLIVTGIGKVRAAAAVGYLASRSSPVCWLNVGTAGHAELPTGTVRMAHKITDQDTGRAFYPQWVIDAPAPTADLVTVSRPVDDFPGSALYDMEASGFFEAARHFVTLEWIHAVKVVSDNRETAFRKDRVGVLMEAALPVVEQVAVAWWELHGSLEVPLPLDLARIAAAVGLTKAQTRQVERLLRKWQALSPETLPGEAQLCRMDRETLLAWMRRRVHD